MTTLEDARRFAESVLGDPLNHYKEIAFLHRVLHAEAQRKQGKHEKTFHGGLRRGTSVPLAAVVAATSPDSKGNDGQEDR